MSTLAAAQQKYVAPRINEPLDEGRRTVLKGNIHPLARAQFEVAAAPPNLRMDRMLLVLKRTKSTSKIGNVLASIKQIAPRHHCDGLPLPVNSL